MPDVKKLIEDVDRAILMLALELPSAVHFDISKKWKILADQLKEEDDYVDVPMKLDVAHFDSLTMAAKKNGVTRESYVRECLIKKLIAEGWIQKENG